MYFNTGFFLLKVPYISWKCEQEQVNLVYLQSKEEKKNPFNKHTTSWRQWSWRSENEHERAKNASLKLEINDGGKMLKERNDGKTRRHRQRSMQNATSNYNLINKLTVFLVSSLLMFDAFKTVHLSRYTRTRTRTIWNSILSKNKPNTLKSETEKRRLTTIKKNCKKIDSTNRLQ